MGILSKENVKSVNIFKEYKAIVEKHSGYNIRNLRSNQGGEYTSNYSKVLCKHQGIRQH
jgi:hypothetical protein